MIVDFIINVLYTLLLNFKQLQFDYLIPSSHFNHLISLFFILTTKHASKEKKTHVFYFVCVYINNFHFLEEKVRAVVEEGRVMGMGMGLIKNC